jgi:enediyne biosynthesis protein E4
MKTPIALTSLAARMAALAVWACLVSETLAEGPIVFLDVTPQTGIAFKHNDGSSGKHYILESMASGLATFDYDGDGLIDIYFLNGRPLRGTKTDADPKNRLYRNLGGFRFADVTDKARVGDAGYGLGVAIGDYDNDGRPDIYVNCFGPNVLYHNNGDGTFTDVTPQAGVARGATVGAGTNFLDADEDGNLDLFVANYVGFTYENHVTQLARGIPVYPGPRDYPNQPSNLFRNNGDGTFRDISADSGIAAHAGSGMGTVCMDYDNDGHTDIFVCNDQSWNFLFHGDGRAKFQDVALAAGVACSFSGEAMSSMGADCGDCFHDGRFHILVTDFEAERPALFRNLGKGLFEDAGVETGLAVGSLAYVKWGCGFVDFDNDGYKDVFIGCGHLQDLIWKASDRGSYEVRPVVFRNTGDGRFENVSDSAGDGAKVLLVARGVAFDDMDNDGRVDVAIQNSRRPPVILRNVSATGNHWIQVQLRGAKTNRDGVGARVKVVAGDLVQIDEVRSGRGYQSHFGSRLHFGLGKRDRVDRIEVRWTGGGVDVFDGLGVDRLVSIGEGTDTSLDK